MHDELLWAALDGLQLAPGASWSEILARYRQLAKCWHPDRFHSQFDKDKAEYKLKYIIACKELLEAHYLSDQHRPDSYCICGMRPHHRQAQPPPHPPPRKEQQQQQQQQQQRQQSNSPPHGAPPHPQQSNSPPHGTPPHPPPSSPPPPKPPPRHHPPPSDPDGKGKRKATDPTKNKGPWDWANELCQYLDLGPLNADEPAWFETYRQWCDKILGKHPGETILDVWDKPPTLTKDHKRKCLLMALITIIIADKIIVAIDPDAFKSPEERNHHTPAESTAPAEQIAPTGTIGPTGPIEPYLPITPYHSPNKPID